ncbi:MAG: NFACT RNA binding domain-containing protein, partial [Ardenticatenaceae bacterium]
WVAWVGRNARQNDEVTFHIGAADDLWLHARGVPGSHVILKSAGRSVPKEIIARAAAFAAHYSQARGSTEVAVDITERRHVRRISGARPGLVTYRNERTVHVKPQAPDDEG